MQTNIIESNSQEATATATPIILSHDFNMGDTPTPKVLKSPILRRGKWCDEETVYCDRIVSDFELGLLDILPSTHLRQYLGVLLHCEQMRISKKFRDIKKGKNQLDTK